MLDRAALEKLRWRCSRRALLELDVLLSRFLEDGFQRLSEAEQALFVELADEEDHDLWHWISGQSVCEDSRFVPVLARLSKKDALMPN